MEGAAQRHTPVYDIADNSALMTRVYERLIAERRLMQSGDPSAGRVLQDA